MVKNINKIKDLHDHFMKPLNKQFGKELPFVKELPFAKFPQSAIGMLDQVINKRDAAIRAKEAAVKRWDEEIQRHDRTIKRLNKQLEAEKKAAEEAMKAKKEKAKTVAKTGVKKEGPAKPGKVASKTTTRKKPVP